MQHEQLRHIIRFGPFELDLRSGELSGDGVPIPIQDQPFQILKLLTARPGEVVSRDEIRSQLWPDDTVVEFENAVNAAIKKLRIALGDSAEEPRYIQTLRRRGYRLMVPLEPLDGVSELEGVTSAEVDVAQTSVRARSIRSWWLVLGATGLVVVLAAGYGWSRWQSRAKTKLTERDSIVLGDFQNKTNDAVFSETLRQGLAVQLGQSPFLNLVSDERIGQVLELMSKPANTVLSAATALEVCQRTGSAVVLEGSIASLGSEYVLGLRARNCRTGAVLDEEQMQASRKEEVLHALSQMASNFRTRMGESLDGVGRLDTPLAEATTPSLEALKAYSMAWKVLSSSGNTAAVPLYQRAVEIDPQFAMAYAMLGRMYGDSGEFALSAENITKAWKLRSHANDRERFFIDASYEIGVLGNLEKAERTCKAWKETYPREARVRGFLAGIVYPMLGKYEAAQDEARMMVTLDPDFAIGYSLVALTSVPMGKVGEAHQAIAEARKRGLDLPDFLIDEYQFAFLIGDRMTMERVAALGAKMSGAADSMAAMESFTAAYAGRLELARGQSELAVRLADQTGQKERAAAFESGAALRESFWGNGLEGRQHAAAALKLSQARDIQYGAAFALALAGDVAEAQRLADDLERKLPEDTAVRFSYVPAVRGLIAIARNEPAKAVEALRVASAYEYGQPPSSFIGLYGVCYPIYVRGEAYLALHQGVDAVAEFRKIVDHRTIVVNDPVGAMARLELARAYGMAGDTAKEKVAYEDFLGLWKDADASLPVLQQARAEYAQLH